MRQGVMRRLFVFLVLLVALGSGVEPAMGLMRECAVEDLSHPLPDSHDTLTGYHDSAPGHQHGSGHHAADHCSHQHGVPFASDPVNGVTAPVPVAATSSFEAVRPAKLFAYGPFRPPRA